ncbi:glycosyltransferase family 4 protein [Methanobrevibacter sp. DSM 116169]|uniref:glycosyltransferase family 4 protein n=1 Tax=Methanobrevibacter sp. DSM 116169 TaxID=3242727 RepID=UPI0038FD258E
MNNTDILILFLISFFSSVFFTYYIKRILVNASIGDSPIVSEHRHKKGTPTMGGIAFLFTLLLIIAIYYNNIPILITSYIMVAAGIMGLIDDLIGLKVKEVQKVVKNISNHNISLGRLTLAHGDEARAATPKAKEEVNQLLAQGKLELIGEVPIKYETGELEKIVAQVIIGVFLALTGTVSTLGGFTLGFLAYPIVVIAILGAINAVNLIDGMDGLAAGIIAIASFASCLLGYLTGNFDIILPFAIILGLSLGFLVFNKHPASIFMGDTGSFILGAGFAAAVMICDIPYFGVLALGVPIASVIISLMHRAHIINLPVEPLHHTLNYKGMSETTIVYSYWLITAILCIIGLIASIL